MFGPLRRALASIRSRRRIVAVVRGRIVPTVSIVVLCAALAACTDEAASRNALRSHGFSEIEFTGYEMWGCGKGDTFQTGFVATNAEGNRVRGTVCCGWLKDCTVRF